MRLVRLLHITDTHLFSDADGELRGVRSLASFERVLDHVAVSGWRPDGIALTGDLIQDDQPETYDQFGPLLERFGVPILCIPGNHDLPDALSTRLNAAPFITDKPMILGRWVVIGLDSTIPGSHGGRLDNAALDRLRAGVDAATGKHIAVCLHHPPVAMHSRWLDSVGLEDSAAFLDTIAELPRVRLVLFGHAHQAYDGTHEQALIFGTPSTCRQFLPGSDDFALDDKPPAYRKISLNEDGSVLSDLVWVH